MANQHQEKEVEVSRIKGINAFVLMFIIIITMTILTYVLPAGQYDRIESNGRMVVDPESFHYIDSNPVGFLEMFNSVHLGMLEGASIILFVFFIRWSARDNAKNRSH